MRAIKFSASGDAGFFLTVRKRVNNYFQERNLSKHADWRMILKTITLLTLFFAPFILMLTNAFPGWAMLLLAILMGAAYAGIGMSIQHDANHDAYSANPTVNKILGYTMNVIGGCRFNWRIYHNILHHTFTNIHGADFDLENGNAVRLSAYSRHDKIHGLQQYYAWFLYGFATLSWVTLKDFKQFFQVKHDHAMGRNNRTSEFWILVVSKVLYYCYALVLPLMVLDLLWWQVVAGFLLVHFTAGVILGVTFQLAHVVENADQPLPDDSGKIDNAWAIHQMHTTANFARKNKFLNWYLGGLNFQIEHHLFPTVCHIHYSEISKIVKETALEFNLPYNEYETATEAISSHYKMLKMFGQGKDHHMARQEFTEAASA